MKNVDAIRVIFKYIVLPISAIIGTLYSIDTYVIQRANTVVLPTELKVQSIKDDVIEIKERTKRIESILMEKK